MSFTLSPQQDKAVLGFREWYGQLPEVERVARTVYDQKTGEPSEVIHVTRDFGLDPTPYFLLEGFAGTGKSTILPYLVEATGLHPNDIVFCSPTGKAAKVMTKKMHELDMHAFATTIHKAIYRPSRMKAYQIEADLFAAQEQYKRAVDVRDTMSMKDLDRRIKQLQKDLERAYDENAPSFQLEVENPRMMGAQLVVVDECSMVDADMAEDLRSFGVPILAIGDPGQLPPVARSGPGFCNRKADAALTEIHRQALDNPIIWASMLVREGKMIPMGTHGDGLLRVVDSSDDDVTFDLERAVQVICGTHEKRWQITRKIRKLSGFHGMGPQPDESVMIIKNSQKYPGLVNGTMAYIEKGCDKLIDGHVNYMVDIMDEDGKQYTLKCLQAVLEEHYLGKRQATAPKRDVFRARQDPNIHELDYSYAITCHKSQGSQWDDVVVHDQSGVFREDSEKWLYTAITRAAERLTLVV